MGKCVLLVVVVGSESLVLDSRRHPDHRVLVELVVAVARASEEESGLQGTECWLHGMRKEEGPRV